MAMARPRSQPVSRELPVAPLSRVDVLVLPAPDVEALRAEDATRHHGPFRFAAVQEVLLTPQSAGTWETLPGGDRLWRLRVHSPCATDLNLGFTRYALPLGSELWLVSESEGIFVGPYDDTSDHGHGELWTPVVPGDRATVELRVPANAAEEPVLELSRVNHGYRDLFGLREAPQPLSGACNVDVVCPQGDPWRDEIRSVGGYSFGGSILCTGTMLADVPGTFRNWFLSAWHCDVPPATAPSVVVYWNYQVPTCGGPRIGPPTASQVGSTWRASSPESDFLLLELDAAPDPSFAVHYAGWDRSGAVPQDTTAIHHPNGDEKAISFNDDPLVTDQNCIRPTGQMTHWWLDNYELGTTEAGSSGGPLFDDANHRIVGTLSGGDALCENPLGGDCYGKFASHWNPPDATGPAGRLSDWLDPMGTGATSVDGRDPAAQVDFVRHAGVDDCVWGDGDANSVWEPGETVQVVVTLRATALATGVRGTLSTSTPGVMVTDSLATWPTLTALVETDSQAPHFGISIDPAAACGTVMDFRLDVTADAGGPWSFSFSETVGSSLAPDTPVAIVDQGTVQSRLSVGDDVTLTDVNVQVQINHSWVGDLILELESPGGTVVRLLDRPTFPADSVGCGDANMDVLFDDESVTPFELENWCMGQMPWYAGDARPVQPLSPFDGESSRGTWLLHVTDAQSGDIGTIVDWRLVLTPAVSGSCQLCERDPASCFGVPPEPLAAEGGEDHLVITKDASAPGIRLTSERVTGAPSVAFMGYGISPMLIDAYNVYRGTMTSLEAGGLDHAQVPGLCGLTAPPVLDAGACGGAGCPGDGTGYYYLVVATCTTSTPPIESPYGAESDGTPRVAAATPCP